MQLLYFPNTEIKDNCDMTAQKTAEPKTNNERLARLEGQRTLFFTVLGVTVGVAGLLVAILVPLGIWMHGELIEHGKQLTSNTDGLKDVKQGLSDLRLMISVQRLSSVAEDPKNLTNITQAKEILIDAKFQNIRVNPDTIQNTGDKFIKASATQPLAWQAVKQYLNYRSFLNTSLAPSPQDVKPVDAEGWVDFYVKPLSPQGKIAIGVKTGTITPENSALLEAIDKPFPVSKGAELILLEGKDMAIRLDGLHMKNVVIKNLTVEYHNGPLILDNVYFVNCVFDFEQGPKGQELGKAILASTGVTFKPAT